jgi:energy-coupling factor transporter transmembrane protein EcfT
MFSSFGPRGVTSFGVVPHVRRTEAARRPSHSGKRVNPPIKTAAFTNHELGISERVGPSYILVTVGVAISAGICSKLFVRTGTRPIMVAGALFAAGGVYWLSRIPVNGSYLTDLLPGLMITVDRTRRSVRERTRRDAESFSFALINASFQLGAALGLAIFSAVAISRTAHLLAVHSAPLEALASGFHLALLVSNVFLVAAAVIALRATNTRGEPIPSAEPEFESEMNPVPIVEVG